MEDNNTSGPKPKERKQYFLRLDSGERLEVKREVYLCWYAGDRQERYQKERDVKHCVCSYEGLSETTDMEHERAEEVIAAKGICLEDLAIQHIQAELLHSAIGKLSPEEQQLIYALFFDEVGVRSYAREQGVTHRAIQNRRDRILKKLKKMLKGRIEPDALP
jgi:RNA polymerase sigma factor (sigma-70 family)